MQGRLPRVAALEFLIPPSVLLIVYGATAGVSVVQLYAGAFFPGIMLAALYVGYIIVLAKLKPALMPPLSQEERRVALPSFAQRLSHSGDRALTALMRGLKGRRNADVPTRTLVFQLGIAVLPALVVVLFMGLIYAGVTAPPTVQDISGLQQMGAVDASTDQVSTGLAEPPPTEGGVQEPPAEGAAKAEPTEAVKQPAPAEAQKAVASGDRVEAPMGFWIALALCAVALLIFYATFNFARLEIFKMLLGSFFPLALLILAVLGSIVFGLATPSEAAAAGALGGLLLAAAYGRLKYDVVRESVFLTAKTSAMVCWLFVGASIFSASFALLGRPGNHRKVGDIAGSYAG